MSKNTQKEKLIELLKKNWMSSFQMQQAVMSSGADRTMRRIRETILDIIQENVNMERLGY